MVRARGSYESAGLVRRCCRASGMRKGRIEFAWSVKTMANESNTNIPERPQPTGADERINAVPDEKERMEREADKLAHKSIDREHEYDNQQPPFTK